MRASIGLLLLAGATARADTLGLLVCTPAAQSFTIARPAGPPRTVVARTAAEWAAAWKAAGGKPAPPPVDFERQMVVGVVSARPDRVVYRVQLDDAAAPKALEVHLGYPDAPCGAARTPAAARAHLVATPRSALPVRFVVDAMIDGRMYVSQPEREGVDSVEVGVVPAPPRAPGPLRAPEREDAELAVVRSLTPEQRARLALGPMERPLPRVPHGWTRLAVERSERAWLIRYDDLAFDVDVATGAVKPRSP